MHLVSRFLTCILLLHCSCNYVLAQHGKAYDPSLRELKAARHSHYRSIVLEEKSHSKPEKKTVNTLLGAWESITDSTLAKGHYAKVKVAAIKQHGISFNRTGAELHYFYSDSMHRTPWLWGISGDTIVYMITGLSYGDTNVILEQIVSLDKKRIVSRQLGRDTLSSALPCYTTPGMMSAISMSRPRYKGDLKQYLEEGLKSFNPEGEHYDALIKFMVNCKGEVCYAYPFGGGQEEFELRVVDLLKKSGKWIPAGYGGETYDSYHHIEVEWNKGFIDFDYPKANY